MHRNPFWEANSFSASQTLRFVELEYSWTFLNIMQCLSFHIPCYQLVTFLITNLSHSLLPTCHIPCYQLVSSLLPTCHIPCYQLVTFLVTNLSHSLLPTCHIPYYQLVTFLITNLSHSLLPTCRTVIPIRNKLLINIVYSLACLKTTHRFSPWASSILRLPILFL
jgi:hypothetical protein